MRCQYNVSDIDVKTLLMTTDEERLSKSTNPLASLVLVH